MGRQKGVLSRGRRRVEVVDWSMTANIQDERFQSGAEQYAAYLQTPDARLRLDLAFANLQEFLPRATQTLCALDVGCGTGATALRLARLGIHVTLLDSSSPMLDLAIRSLREAGVTDKIELKHGDATEVASLCGTESFDVVLCHNILEYVEDPVAILRSANKALRNSSAILSVLVRSQAGEVLKAAIQQGDLVTTETTLTAEWGHEALYGGKVRLFASDNLDAMLKAASLSLSAVRGVRVVSDYLPAKVSRDADYERIFQLERRLGRRPEFAAIARYTHCLAHRAASAMEDDQ